MDSLPPNDRSKIPMIDPDVMKRVQALKDDLVLQVAFETGPFWNEVRKIRIDWSIEAPVHLPPEEKGFEWTYRISR